MNSTRRKFFSTLGLLCAVVWIVGYSRFRSRTFAEGEAIYRRSCALCHGVEGTGALGPDLTQGSFRLGNSDSDLFQVIDRGIVGTQMPSSGLTAPEVQKVVTFVRRLSRARGPREIPGDPKNGRKIFEDLGTCLTCHKVDGVGGRRGPDLSRIGWMRAPEFLRETMTQPGKVIDAEFRMVDLVTAAGERIQALRLNESTYSVQVIDELENLRSFEKSELQSYSISDISLMPAYDEQSFTAGEMDDLVAYLYSLRRK